MDVGSLALRHRAVLLSAIAVATLGGAFAASTLPSGIYPEVDFPRIAVVASGGDAPPDVFLTTTVRPLEQSLVTVLGVRRVRSRTIRGSSEISLQFVPGTDMWRALQLVESRVNATRADLPEGTTVEVERLTPTAFPVLTYNLSGPLDRRALRELGDLVVRPALARVPGVGQVRVLGGDVREIEVLLDPQRTASLHLRPQDVAARVRAEVPLQAVGRYDEHHMLVTVLASGETLSLDDLANVPVTVTQAGAPLPLSAIAQVEEGAVDPTTRVGGPHGETVLLSVSRLEGASTPEVVAAVQAAAHDLARTFPSGVRLETVYDQAELVDESIGAVRDAILIGILLCVLVLGVSLRDWRTGVIAGITVPITLAITFLPMKLLHGTLNLMSLGGMAIAIGLVIDDAIIVIEAVARRLEQGEPPARAAAGGATDLAPAVLGTTITTVIVFVPLAFVPGLVGDFFSALALSLSASVVLSMLVALTLVPALAARFLRPRKTHDGPTKLEQLYARVANWGAARPWVGPLLALLSIAGAYGASLAVPSGFLPEMDEGAFVLDYFLPAGTSLGETDTVARRIEHVLATTPGVRTFSRRTGAELGPITATLLSRGDIMVRLAPRGRRKPIDDVISDVRVRLEAEVPEARVEFVQVLQDVLNDLAGNPRPIEVKLFGERYDELRRLAREVTHRLERVPGVVDVYGGAEADGMALEMRVGRDSAARMGRTTQDVADELHAMLAGMPAGTVRRVDRLIGIRVRYPDRVRFDPEQIADLPLSFTDGAPVPVRAVATPDRVPVPTELVHEGLQPAVIVTADHEGRDLGAVMKDLRRALAGVHVPGGYRLELGGQYASQREGEAAIGAVAAFGLLLTFLVLVGQLRRVRPALAIVATTPFALVGAMVTLLVTRVPLNASSLMGCVLLVGLEVKSGILLLEVAEEHAAQGMPYVEALAEAARRRIRPIMLTTTATMFGVLPLALGLGAGSEIHQPLAIAVLGGIAISKFLNLVALPSLAVLMHGRGKPAS